MSCPLVLVLTSPIAAWFSAQCVSAINASPLMPGSKADILAALDKVDALALNLGGADEARGVVLLAACNKANHSGLPWVLDPVGAGGGPDRSQLAQACLAAKPSLIKANAAETRALAGQSARLRGIDSLDNPDTAIEAAAILSKHASLLVTGESDLVQLAGQTAITRIQGGSSIAPRLVGTGCALGAVAAACLVQFGPHDAPKIAAALFKSAALYAEGKSAGLGSFAMAFLDGLEKAYRDL